MDSPSLPIKISTKIPAASLLSPSLLPLDPLTRRSHSSAPPSDAAPGKKSSDVSKVEFMSSCHKPLHMFNEVFQNSTLLQLTFLLAQCFHHCHWHLVGHRLVMLDGALGALCHLMLTQLFLWLRKRDQESLNSAWYIRYVGYLLSSRSKLTKPRKETRIKQGPRSLRV